MDPRPCGAVGRILAGRHREMLGTVVRWAEEEAAEIAVALDLNQAVPSPIHSPCIPCLGMRRVRLREGHMCITLRV